MVPMVKADAYGLGVAGAVGVFEEEDPWGYGVATVPEGLAIRKLGVERPILVLSPAPADGIAEGVAAGLTFCVSEIEAVRRVVRAAEASGRDTSVHVEVDTGMGRAGFDWREVGLWGPAVRELTRGAVHWEGVFTHLHSADEPASDSVAIQSGRFQEVMQALDAMDWGGTLSHLANSAGVLRRPDLARSLVRPGIFLYGGAAGPDLSPPGEVVTLRARVVLAREVPAGTTLGYGATHQAQRAERWATLGIGYGDGLPRQLGNRGRGILAGRPVPIIGRISMDLTVVDITDLPGGMGEVGDVVTLLGTDGAERISLEEVAGLAGTIGYEILTGLTTRLPRVWLG